MTGLLALSQRAVVNESSISFVNDSSESISASKRVERSDLYIDMNQEHKKYIYKLMYTS